MQYQRLGDTGLVVSRLSLGAMTFGSGTGAMGSVWKVDQALANRMVSRSLDAGINLIDTADIYAAGQSEEMLGKALGPRRKDVIIATKVGFRTGPAIAHTGLSCGHVIRSAEASLKRLGTDYIDIYTVHRKDPHTPVEETLQALDDLVRRGLVRYVGYSNLDAWEASKIVTIQRERHWARFVVAQMYYSLVGRDIEYETVPFLRDSGTALVVWSPLAGGFLTGRYTREAPDGGKGRLSGFDFIPIDRERGYLLIDRMKGMAQSHGSSVAQLALSWLLTKPYVTSVLVGASKMDQLEDNLAAIDVVLTPEEVRQLDALTTPEPLYPAWHIDKTGDPAVTEALTRPAASGRSA